MNLTKIQNTAALILEHNMPKTRDALNKNQFTALELENIRSIVSLAARFILDDKETQYLNDHTSSPQMWAQSTDEDKLTCLFYISMIYANQHQLLAARIAEQAQEQE